MLRPSINEILKPGESYYSLVMAVAKRAREIADEEFEEKETVKKEKALLDKTADKLKTGIEKVDFSNEKPVRVAVREFAQGKYHLVEDPNIGKDIEEE